MLCLGHCSVPQAIYNHICGDKCIVETDWFLLRYSYVYLCYGYSWITYTIKYIMKANAASFEDISAFFESNGTKILHDLT